jgi:ABC-type multidrug transport system fused ATPase/permease subunit
MVSIKEFLKVFSKKFVFEEVLLVSRFLSSREKKRIVLLVVTQISLSLLDLIAISLVGLVGLFALNGVGIQTETRFSAAVTSALNISELSFQAQTAILASIATALLVTRTLISMALSYRTLNFLAFKSTQIAKKATEKYFTSNYEAMKKDSRVNTIYTLTDGIDRLVSNGFGSYLTLIADCGLLFILVIGLSTFDIQTSVLVLFVVASIGLVMHFLQKNLARNLGAEVRHKKIMISNSLLQLVDVYRELKLRGTLEDYTGEVSKMRSDFSIKAARLSFYPNTGKYVLEISIVIAALLVSAAQFAIKDAPSAIVSLITFLAVGSRVIPAVARIQSNLVTMRSVFGASANTISLLSKITDISEEEKKNQKFDSRAIISFSKVYFRYADSNVDQISDVDFEINEGETVAIVGRSGAGKSTIFDLILGFAKPNKGVILIEGKSPLDFIAENSCSVSFVPQEVHLLSGTLKENILLGLPISPETERRVGEILKDLNLVKFSENLDCVMDEKDAPGMIQVSGGEKQRIGIARALVTNPRIVLLDEATSSLDALTEKAVSDTLLKLRKNKTVIVIAHRLSTAKNADKIIYLHNGRIEGCGSFEELRRSLPDFATQASLLGL